MIIETRLPAIREMASPWKIGSVRITLAPTTTASAVTAGRRFKMASIATPKLIARR